MLLNHRYQPVQAQQWLCAPVRALLSFPTSVPLKDLHINHFMSRNMKKIVSHLRDGHLILIAGTCHLMSVLSCKTGTCPRSFDTHLEASASLYRTITARFAKQDMTFFKIFFNQNIKTGTTLTASNLHVSRWSRTSLWFPSMWHLQNWKENRF